MIRKIGLMAALCLLGGCAHIGVKPWQRDLLARNVMQPDSDGNITGYHDHIYFSKEGSTGGRSADGGGCGCN
jgi:hypothetical protein